MNYDVTLSQTELVHNYEAKIPKSLINEVAQLTIKSPTELTDDKIKFVVKVMLEAAIYSNLGFGLTSQGETRGEELRKSFKQLYDEGIQFTIFASKFSNRGKNIHFPNSFSSWHFM